MPVTSELDRPKTTRSGNPLQGPLPLANVSAIVDNGAQSDLWAFSDFPAFGFSRDHLHPIRLSLSAANRFPISIEGAFFAKLTTKSPQGVESSCRSMVYVSSSVHDMYLSYESLLNLGLLANSFLGVDNTDDHHPDELGKTTHINITRSLNDGCNGCDVPCSCPQHTAPPLRPAELSFPSSPENNDKMKAWLLDRYSASTFNTCPHRPLPCMEGPPIEIHVEPTATPKAYHTLASIPLHWQQRVYDDSRPLAIKQILQKRNIRI